MHISTFSICGASSQSSVEVDLDLCFRQPGQNTSLVAFYFRFWFPPTVDEKQTHTQVMQSIVHYEKQNKIRTDELINQWLTRHFSDDVLRQCIRNEQQAPAALFQFLGRGFGNSHVRFTTHTVNSKAIADWDNEFVVTHCQQNETWLYLIVRISCSCKDLTGMFVSSFFFFACLLMNYDLVN